MIIRFGILLIFLIYPLLGQTGEKAIQAFISKEEGAQIYKAPDLDSDVLLNLPAGTKVKASRRLFGQEIKFRLIKWKGKKGYLPEFEVRPYSVGSEKRHQTAERKKSEGNGEEAGPFLYQTRAGLELGVISTLHLRGDINEREPGKIIALNLSGMGWFLKGLPMSYTFGFLLPNSTFRSGLEKTYGVGVLTQALLQLPVYMNSKVAAFWQMGPQIAWYDFNRLRGADRATYNHFDVGLGIGPAAAILLGNVTFQIAATYFWSQNPFWGLTLSTQGIYSRPR